ncbi:MULTISPECIES: hypothetical protein [Elizabethkingia]|uniref:hypothetical protein n=1 Tax=Elizabethkingia TaxID=308865 RepID=UPI0014088A51|nr:MULTISPECIES: hypothetical protein [Elizabethkingia]MDE5525250.1 hypothetical protein [Elizabethkingia meningoseptica]NHQ66948.1 hypothetical protein [Elizabethkingia miricola]NHQ70185.1 hypothetical protein [Elizabethkingia miricola]NHQ77035.1 hypothetical protein [Elizabethkingia miricola]UIO95070.1 hypothetical protein LYZ41_12800 [Elizabethkingia miricola]
MKNIRINAQNDIIRKIQLALKSCSYGIGIEAKADVTIENIAENSQTLILTPKKERVISENEIFMLGYFVGRDY